jgi:DNA excision repair protein ERCC-8
MHIRPSSPPPYASTAPHLHTLRCMNELLNERAAGRLGQNAFARRICTDLLHAFRPAPRLRFDGGELGTNIDVDESGRNYSRSGRDIWAHQAGVNALALERFDGRM